MNGPTAVSLALTVATLAIAFVRVAFVRKRFEGLVLEGDILGRALLSFFKTSGGPVVVSVIWLVLWALFGVLLVGYLKPAWFSTLYGVLIAVNYTLLVPASAGVYMLLLRSTRTVFGPQAREFFESDRDSSPTFSAKHPLWVFSLLGIPFGALALFTQWRAIHSLEADALSQFEPWLDSHAALNGSASAVGGHMNYWGAIYYSLRGLSASLAIGGAWTGLCVCFRLFRRRDKVTSFLSSGGMVRPVIRELATALFFAAVLGAAVLTLHGLKFVFEAFERDRVSGQHTPLPEILFASTWMLWVILTLAGSSVYISSILRLRRSVRDAVTRIEAEKLRAVGLDDESLAGCAAVEPGRRPEFLLKLCEARAALRRELGQITLLPPLLSRLAPALFSVAQAAQIVVPVLFGLIAKR